MPEVLISALDALENEYRRASKDRGFREKLNYWMDGAVVVLNDEEAFFICPGRWFAGDAGRDVPQSGQGIG